eukprot:TRINITY_DN8976_c0_g2_i7.p5 TRINITY_DN8976_c0_g2~~TRINITY_DN8976_c0_g2_i7.p5  ORF type:complete len:122 (-),score=6.01 TRINITY_DN8976_c0_g2_i7:21-386(-)
MFVEVINIDFETTSYKKEKQEQKFGIALAMVSLKNDRYRLLRKLHPIFQSFKISDSFHLHYSKNYMYVCKLSFIIWFTFEEVHEELYGTRLQDQQDEDNMREAIVYQAYNHLDPSLFWDFA